MISILTTNVFPDPAALRALILDLSAQTCPDFQWVCLDAFHEQHKSKVQVWAEQARLKDYLHVPFCPATHVGRQFHWEGYNNALLLSRHPAFLRMGVYRRYHRQLVEFVTDHADRQEWVNMACLDVPESELTEPNYLLTVRYSLDLDLDHEVRPRLESHCGMYSWSREKMLDMNGNNEAALIHHWEDGEVNSRWRRLSGSMICLKRAMLRVYHSKARTFRAKDVCPHPAPHCIAWAENSHELLRTAPKETRWFEHKGFPWAQCPACKTVAVGDCSQYFQYLISDPRAYRAPVNVAGVGRNLSILQEDLNKLSSLSSKLDLLASSHTDPRYLAE